MKITPLEIKQKTFEKGFRGYDKDEVTAYLQSLSQEWERLLDEKKELTIKLEQSQKEVEKLREVESSLFKTLKTAEDTGANIMDQANKMAEIHLKETEMKAEALMNDAKNKARDTLDDAEVTARQTIEEMEAQLKSLMNMYKTLENYRDDLLSDIKALSSDALDRVERMKSQVRRVDIEEQYMKARRESKKVLQNRISENKEIKMENKEDADKNVDRADSPEGNVEEHPEMGKSENSESPESSKTTKKNNLEEKSNADEEQKKEGSKKKSDSSERSFFDEIE